MALRRERPSRQKKSPAPSPGVDDVFARPLAEAPRDNDLIDPLFDAAAASGPVPLDLHPPDVLHSRPSWLSHSRLHSLQRILLATIVGVAGIFVYTAIVRIKSARTSPVVSAPSPAPEARPQQTPIAPAAKAPAQAKEPPAGRDKDESSLPLLEPLSLQMAEKSYRGGDFSHAFTMYDKLYRRLPATEQNQPVRDFLLLRMALCHKNDGNAQQADTMFRTVALSRLPILRAIARYHQSMILIERQRYLEAATRAYQTIALIEVANSDAAWSAAVRRQCYFLVAEALTRNLLSLEDADAGLPHDLWSGNPEIDPFADLEEAELRTVLDAGRDVLDQATLAPQIRAVAGKNMPQRWSVTCNGASLEEVLARVAGNARINVQWIDSGQVTPGEEVGRRRPVYLHLTSATAQEIVTTAAGSVGLLARMDGRGNVSVVDPSFYASLAEHTQLLAEESVSLWQRFLAGAGDDPRAPNAHFALALVHGARERFDEAIAEYRLVANGAAKHALAPYALLYSGKMKIKLRDYLGAHEDLKLLIELYPDAEFSDQACLELADATMKAALYEEAGGLYTRVFNKGLSQGSQIESALGAGRCYYEMHDHELAARWLNRYIAIAQDQDRPEFHGACLLLGKTYLALGSLPQAQTALNLALRGELSREQHVETISTLVRTYIEQGLFVEALNLLETTQAWQLSQQETIDLLLLRVRVLRSIGLVDKAIALLGEEQPFLPGPQFKGAVALELAQCQAANGQTTQAIETLSNALAIVEPGELAQQIGVQLATLYLRAHQPERAISVCAKLLSDAAQPQREPLLKLEAQAYREQKEYGRAVAVLLTSASDRMQSKPADSTTPNEQKQQ
jgi:tetratricopeptide (TPR) repeat protein